jgi:hypothetical protein
MHLKSFVAYVFYNPRTDRIFTAEFGFMEALFRSEDRPYGVLLRHTGVTGEFTGKYGYVLLGEL